jgi:hypothetical protein
MGLPFKGNIPAETRVFLGDNNMTYSRSGCGIPIYFYHAGEYDLFPFIALDQAEHALFAPTKSVSIPSDP